MQFRTHPSLAGTSLDAHAKSTTTLSNKLGGGGLRFLGMVQALHTLVKQTPYLLGSRLLLYFSSPYICFSNRQFQQQAETDAVRAQHMTTLTRKTYQTAMNLLHLPGWHGGGPRSLVLVLFTHVQNQNH